MGGFLFLDERKGGVEHAEPRGLKGYNSLILSDLGACGSHTFFDFDLASEGVVEAFGDFDINDAVHQAFVALDIDGLAIGRSNCAEFHGRLLMQSMVKITRRHRKVGAPSHPA